MLQVVEGVADRPRRLAEILAIFPALAERRRRRAGTLSGGERQQLAFARALMPQPRLRLLDEPTAGLTPRLMGQVFELIAGLPARGIAALLVEQQARMSLEFSHRGYILHEGRVVLTGTASALLADPATAASILAAAAEFGAEDPGGA